jgi:hypothetical protein
LGNRDSEESIRQTDEQLPAQINVHRLHTNEYNPSSFIQKLWNQILFLVLGLRFVLENPKSYDLIYVSSPPIFPAFAGIILKYLIGSKLTVELRDVWPDAIAPHSPLEDAPMSFRIFKSL